VSAYAAGPSSDSSPSDRETVDRAVDGARQQVNGQADQQGALSTLAAESFGSPSSS
jgi:hypothetical protein